MWRRHLVNGVAAVALCVGASAASAQNATQPTAEDQIQRILRGATAKTKGEAAVINQVVDEASEVLDDQSKSGRSKGKAAAESISSSVANTTANMLGGVGATSSYGLPMGYSSTTGGLAALGGSGSTPTKEDLRRQYQQTCGNTGKNAAAAAMCVGLAAMVESVGDGSAGSEGGSSSYPSMAGAMSPLGGAGSTPTKEDLRRQYQQTCGNSGRNAAAAAMCVGLAAMVESVDETNHEASRAGGGTSSTLGRSAETGATLGTSRQSTAKGASSMGASSMGAIAGAGPNNCPVTLAHLDAKLPRYDNPQISSLRRMIVETNIVDTLNDMRSQPGFSVEAVARASMQSAQQAEQALQQTEECIRQSSSDAEGVMQRLRSGQAGARGHVGLNTTCQQAYIVAYYSMVANREIAVATACHARMRP